MGSGGLPRKKAGTEQGHRRRTEKQECFIIASGPSLTKSDVEKTRDFDVIAINTNYQIAPHAKYLYACDGLWWDQYIKDVREKYTGELWTQDAKAAKDYGLNYVESKPGNGFIADEFIIKQGQNSGYQAINLAYHLGYNRVILLGYDMGSDGNKSRWHKDHPSPCGNHNNHKQFIENFNHMSPPIEVINCSRKTAVTAFPKIPLEEIIKTIA